MSGAILQPGRNCWQLEHAHHWYAVQDAAEYFRLVRHALLSARRTVFILGWDTTAGIDLDPGTPPSNVPTRFDKLLKYISRRRRHLRCFILTWDYGLLFTLERDPFSRFRFGWAMPRQIRFEFDDRHPLGASHHQKIVVIDDQLAFCGGIDLTGHRWDTPAHRPDEPLRRTQTGKPYGPYHEMQVMVDGPVAARLGTLARERWRALGAERMPAVGVANEDLWPTDVTPDLREVNVGISRTMPGSGSQPAVRECEALFLDSIAAAKRTIYIENQYFTNLKLTDALIARLAEPRGPEVVIAVPRDSHGWLEKQTVGAIRDNLFRRLIQSDPHKRLRLVAPVASRARDIATFVHSKVTIIDDDFVRIGSANCSHRSMGVDTECDLSVEANGDRGVQTGIRHIRDRLIAEHLGLRAEDVGPAIEQAGSLAALLDAHDEADHTLARVDIRAEPVEPPSEAVRNAVDPDEPLNLGESVDQLVPAVDATIAPSPLRLWAVPAVALVAAAGFTWASYGSFRLPELSLVTGVFALVIGGLALIPLEVLAFAAGVLLGGPAGGLVALVGSIAAAVIGYFAGRVIGTARLSRWMSRRSYRSGRQLGARGTAGIAVLHLASVASAGAIHLLCGAGRVPFGRYVAGTAIGLVPPVAALVWLGAVLRTTLMHPSLWNGFYTVAAAVAVAGVAYGLRTILLIRQFAPAASGHRQRAEFG
jgi:phosphatidylserine/phosphatidylglycerophosphate/cardiolipin synthase-like enzyme/uncharacterized membrane protein YdjX (TVP38/TMEM64 family)